jgi:two-component system chemotaxis response regulator CheY
MRALIVDDSRTMRALIGKLVRELGFDVTEAGNGGQALAELRNSGGADLTLVDWNMPEMNGLEFVRAVRANPAYGTMKVVMVTSQTEVAQMIRALQAGVDEYLMKPFTREAMIEKLRLLGIPNI